MPTISQALVNPALRQQTVWRFLRSLPASPWTVADLAAVNAGLPDLGWTASNVTTNALGDGVVWEGDVQTDRVPQGSSGTAFFGALIFPGPPELLVLVIEMSGGYPMAGGDYLTFTLRSLNADLSET